MKRRTIAQLLIGLVLVVSFLLPNLGRSDFVLSEPKPQLTSIEPYFYAAQFAQGQAVMRERLKLSPGDDQARFGLGMLQLMEGVERLTQFLYRYGLRHNWLTSVIPIIRLPIPTNPQPESLAYAAAGQMLQTWLADLTTVQATLEPIVDASVKLPLRLGAIRLDIDNDGRVTEKESFRRLFEVITGASVPEADARAFQIGFDYGDVLWLRGYCHLLSAMAEVALAHDGQDLFNATAQLLFAKPETPYGFLQQGRRPFEFTEGIEFTDVVAFFHLLRFPVAEPMRMTNALEHLRSTLALSRQSWQAIGKETDNDREWLPNPQQTGVIPNAQITKDMIDSWLVFVGETENLLAGKVLAPFWRGDDDRGINLQRVFTEPRTVDAVLWIQGTAAAPYLESGKLTDAGVWGQLLRVFGGQFFSFAAWFN